ncbi:MAG: lysophospholipid acyltransferase family protein [Bryobacteraceae bacterium]
MATAVFDSVIPRIVPFPLPRAIRDLLSRALGFDELARVYDALQSAGDRPITDRLLGVLSVRCAVSDADIERIPRAGAAIVTANHPFGILEGAALAALLGRVRSDVRILANGILTAIPELRDLVIPVDPMSGPQAAGGNGHGLRRALEHLGAGGMLVIFPAGEVSHFCWRERGVSDPGWNPAVARLVNIAARRGVRVPVLPAFVDGANGALFQAAGMVHPRLRTALLGRELLNKRGRRVEVRIGTPVESDRLLAIPSPREQVDYLRWRTYLLARRERFKPLTSRPLDRPDDAQREAVAGPIPPEALAREIGGLPADHLLNRSGDLEVYLANAAAIPQTLLELGRLREITFRAAGEGTGKRLDLDRFDEHYLHLFVWNARRQEVVGAYRLVGTDTAGTRGLYTATLFRYRPEFLDRLGPAVELGRSFIRAEYQKGFAPLLLLWKGIGAFLVRNPRYTVLFGPVSISNQYAAVSRELMVGFLEKYAMLRGWAGLVRGRNPFRRRLPDDGLPSAGFDVEDLSTILGDVEQNVAGVPVLLRQYLRLGGKLLGFNVDAKFANALDGLILVDLTKTEPKLIERYLGKEYLKGQHGTH